MAAMRCERRLQRRTTDDDDDDDDDDDNNNDDDKTITHVSQRKRAWEKSRDRDTSR